MDKKYQVMRDLTPEEYAGLKADIAKRGVQVPVIFDEDGFIIEGHNRVAICEELGITDYPKEVRRGLSEQEKRDLARALNVQRRQLTREEKREAIRAQIIETPDKSNRQIAEQFGVSHHTVGNEREKLESGGQIAQLKETKGADGKTYKRPEPKPKQEVQKKQEAQENSEEEEVETNEKRKGRPPLNPGGFTKEEREQRERIASIVDRMYDPDAELQYTVGNFVETLTLNGEAYISQLDNELSDHIDLITVETLEIIDKAIETIINKIQKVREKHL